MMTDWDRGFISMCINQIVVHLLEEDPALTPGEIYDVIAQDLERRCRADIEKAQRQ